MVNALSTLVGEELEGGATFFGTLAAPNGSLYGIPFDARRVVKFDPVDKSMTHIGPEFGGGGKKWSKGAMTDSGIIYCPPCDEDHGILKIDTNTDNVTELDVNILPERGGYMWGMWLSCAVALDGCIYCMPTCARRMMKIDPNNNDAMSSVGDDLGHGICRYSGTVVGIDGCVYGLPYSSKHILKYDPINDNTSFVGEVADKALKCTGGVLGRDGCIYALAENSRVLKIDTTNNSHCFVGFRIQLSYHVHDGWGDAILGIDGCIYWPPDEARCILKYDPHTLNGTTLHEDFERQGHSKWMSGALATDGVIYCLPSNANRVLAIDPIGEFLATTKANMQEHPEEFGSLFRTTLFRTIEADDDSTLLVSLTNFDQAVIKFGYSKVFEILEKCIEPVNDFCIESNSCPFMIAVSYKDSTLCAINYLLRRDLSWVNSCIGSLKGNGPKNKHYE